MDKVTLERWRNIAIADIIKFVEFYEAKYLESQRLMTQRDREDPMSASKDDYEQEEIWPAEMESAEWYEQYAAWFQCAK